MSKKNDIQPETGARVRIGEHVTIYPRGKRRVWTADFHYIDAQGRRKHGRRSLGTKNGRTAEVKARKIEDELARGEYTPKPEPQAPETIESANAKFIDAKRTDACARKTIVKYEGELKRFARFAEEHGVRTLSAITLSLIDAYKAHRKDVDQLDSYSLYNHLIILKTMLKWCRKRQMIAADPLADLTMREPRRRRHPAARFEQVNAVLAKAAGEQLALLATLAFCGLRIGEARALRPQDVDLDGGVLHVRGRGDWGPKTEGSQRDVPIHARLLVILAAKPKGKGGTFFNAPPSRQYPAGDHGLNPREVNEQFQALAKGCGFAVGRDGQGLTLHALRRFFKTFCLDAGVPKPMVDAWMGHRDQSDMDFFYYDPAKSKEWIGRVPFGSPDEQEASRVRTSKPAA